MENVARTAQMRNSCLILVVKSKVTKSLGASRSKYKFGLQRNTSEEKTEMSCLGMRHSAHKHGENSIS